MSIERAMRLLEWLACHGPHTVRGMARELDLPLGSTHRILTDLGTEGVVERTADGEWELSYRLLQIVGLQLERIKLPQLAHPILEQLAAETRETAFLVVPSRDEIVYLDKVQTNMQLQLNVELGTRRPMHCTGLGKAVLAYLPQARQEQILAHAQFMAYTSNTITDPLLLASELGRVRERGYATDQEEIIVGVHCIAVPLLNHLGQVVGAISIAGTGPKIGSERFEGLLGKVRTAGESLSHQLGYRPPNQPSVVNDGGSATDAAVFSDGAARAARPTAVGVGVGVETVTRGARRVQRRGERLSARTDQ